MKYINLEIERGIVTLTDEISEHECIFHASAISQFYVDWTIGGGSLTLRYRNGGHDVVTFPHGTSGGECADAISDLVKFMTRTPWPKDES